MSDIQPGAPKKKRKGLIVLGIILAVLVVVIGGCAVLFAVVFSNANVDVSDNASMGSKSVAVTGGQAPGPFDAGYC
jgi:flagellar basal body-associated protein FliL